MKRLFTALTLCWFLAVPAASDSESLGLPPHVWAEIQELTASDAVSFDQFGSDVSISVDTLVAGANHNREAGLWPNPGRWSPHQRRGGNMGNRRCPPTRLRPQPTEATRPTEVAGTL